MTKGKKLYLAIVVAIIVSLGIWSIILDFSRFPSLNFEYDIYPSALLKRINVILAASIAWSAGRDRLSPRDSVMMKIIFLFICLAESAFAFRWREAGICLFAVCQILLAVRHSTGLFYGLNHAGILQKKRLLIISLVIIAMLAAFPILLNKIIIIHKPVFIVYLYGLLLSVSLWAGLANSILGMLPGKNSGMAAAGMICFYCCDVLVGLDAVLEAGLPWLMANSFIWIFYIPALVLLALSSYKPENIFFKTDKGAAE